MKLLVTGGAGFIGSNFIHYWLRNHSEDWIVNLDTLTYAGNLENLRSIENDPRYTFVEGDIRNRELVEELVPRIDTVVHFAAESHVDRSIDNPAEFVLTNVVGTQVLLDACRNNGNKRFHHISTDEVFGDLPLGGEEKFTEDTSYDPSSAYSASKAGSDHLARAYYKTYGLPITITNCSNNYGPYQSVEKMIPRNVTNVLLGEKFKIYGEGKNVRDWLYVDDHCSAIEKVLLEGEIGETYCVGGDAPLSNIELAKIILEIMGKDESGIEYVEDRKGHDRRYDIDPSKLRKELDWKQRVTFEEGIRKTIQWYEENREWWEEGKKEVEHFYNK